MQNVIDRILRTILLALAVALVAFALTPSTADAQRRPLYAGFGLGPYALFSDNGYYGGCCDVQFRGQGEFGWHPSGNDTGFFLAANLTLTGGNNFFVFMPGLRLGGDIEVFGRRDIAVLLRPSALLGAGFFDPRGNNNTLGFFVIQPAFDVRIALADRLIQLWVRPIAFDFLLFPEHYDRDFHWHAGYSFLAGLDFAF